MWLFLIFIIVPLIEIALFLKVGALIGFWPTLAIIIGLSFFGTWLLRTQGALAFRDLRASLANMRDPTEPMAHGMMIMFAGVLLVTPGFFTDALGLALLIRPVRTLVIRSIARHFQIVTSTTTAGSFRSMSDADDVIDATYTEFEEKSGALGPSGRTRH